MAKFISKQAVIGQRGMALVESVILEMGHIWHPMGQMEAGIDGLIEIRRNDTGEVTNFVVQAQVKATTIPWPSTENTLSWPCQQRDIDYWCQGNVPVILVVCNPETKEAYWVNVKEYFRESSARNSRRVNFSKIADKFDRSAGPKLVGIAIPRNSGLYFGPEPKQETLVTNLLRVASFPSSIWFAEVPDSDAKSIWATLRAHSKHPTAAWNLSGSRILSFQDLSDPPWNRICDQGTVEKLPSSVWSESDDPQQTREFIRLSNLALQAQLSPELRFDRESRLYYFTSGPGLRERLIRTGSRRGRTVFSVYHSKSDPSVVSYCRHMGFEGNFRCLDGEWYLQVLPTYRFTRDGMSPSAFAAETLSGIKRLERHEAVRYQLLFWIRYLTRPRRMFDPDRPLIRLEGPVELEGPVGLFDETWNEMDLKDIESTPGSERPRLFDV